MDFTGRSSQPSQPASTGPQYSGGNGAAANNKKTSKVSSRPKLVRWGAGALGLLIVALFVAVIFVIGFGGTKSEASYVDSNKLQAVFLQTGQVYFGKIDKNTMSSKSFVLSKIYYLQTSNGSTTAATSTSNTNVSLVKLGCELHAPYDQMVINRDQVTFWENLQDNGQVAKAVATFEKDNPNGQKCADQSSAPNSSTNVQGSSTSNTNSSSSTNSSSTTKQ